jgi:MFS family permease
MVGLLMFAVSITAFGFASNIVALDALRFVQGSACGCLWSGGLTWVIAVAPRERRGELLGTAIAAAIFGTILGPVMGTLAVAVVTLGGPLTAYTVPAMAVITDSAERLGITLVLSSMLFNIAWAIGEIIGAPAAASISQATSDAVPLALLAAIMLATFVSVIAIGLGPTPEVSETKPVALAADPDWSLTRPTRDRRPHLTRRSNAPEPDSCSCKRKILGR